MGKAEEKYLGIVKYSDFTLGIQTRGFTSLRSTGTWEEQLAAAKENLLAEVGGQQELW